MYIHDAVRAYVDTRQAAGTKLRINQIRVIFEGNGVLRAGLGTRPALIAQVDPVVPGCGEPAFNAKGRLGRVHFPEVGKGARQLAGPASGTSFVNGSQFQSQNLPYQPVMKQSNGIFLKLRSLRRP
jgi:hypothetical protein